MAELTSLGLKSLKMGDVDPTNIQTTYAVELKHAQVGSATIEESEATEEHIRTEQSSSILRTIVTEPGIVTYTVQLYDLSTDQIKAVKGGATTAAAGGVGKRWGRTESAIINKAIEITTLDNVKVYFPNANVQARITWPTTKTGLGTITVKFTAQDHPKGDIVIEEPVVSGGGS